MPATEPLCNLIGVNSQKFSKEENLILEAELFTRIYEALKEQYRMLNKAYFYVMKFTIEMENSMLEKDFIRFIIKDILSSEEYTLQGIARYTSTHEDVIYELASGRNTAPTATCFRKLIELHRSCRRELYALIIKKIILEYTTK